MSNRHQHKSLLTFWSVRYFLVLLLCMTAVGTGVIYFVNQEARMSQKRDIEQAVHDISINVSANSGELPAEELWNFYLTGLSNDRSATAYIWIYDHQGELLQSFPHPTPVSERIRAAVHPLDREPRAVVRTESFEGEGAWLVASAPIETNGQYFGHVVYAMKELQKIEGVFTFQAPRLVFMFSVLLSGWVVIYMLTKRFVRPIQEVERAAKQIVDGQYRMDWEETYQITEFSKLQASFQEMADRLNRLESLRMQLLAGVTHELKTPVTSISGLIQAVRDGVVSGAEAEEFLDVCLKESNRLQTMVDDLLEFNRFASGSVLISLEHIDVKNAVEEIVHRWQLAQDRTDYRIELHASSDSRDNDWQVETDPARLEQIIVNLLNNALAAIPLDGQIRITLLAEPDRYRIKIRDTGIGIAEEDKDHVFDPFYRGHNKKWAVRGLGLGLPFSRRIARSLGGDLVLASTNSEGTVFVVSIPR